MFRLEKLTFYLLIFLLPLQTRQILFQWGSGFNEWTSAYLYLSDLLIFVLFAFWFWRSKKKRFLKKLRQVRYLTKQPDFWLVVFVLITFFSLIQARNLQLGLYQWFKLLEMIGFFYYLRFNLASQAEKRKLSLKRLSQVFIGSVLVQSVIALLQYVKQADLGLRFLAESPLDLERPGVAKMVVEGVKIIRPYGGFPHPHLLAVFILTAVFFLLSFLLAKKQARQRLLIKRVLLLALLFFFFFIFYLIFSRSIMAALAIALIGYFSLVFIKEKQRKRATYVLSILVLLIVVAMVFSYLLWPELSARFVLSLEDQSVALRLFYDKIALEIIRDSPWLGIGWGNFVWEMKEALGYLKPWLHQPVHNFYLLIISQAGWLALVSFLFFVWLIVKRTSFQSLFGCALFFVFLAFLLIGFFDHFFWTLQQGQLIFWLVLGLLAGQGNKKRPP